MPTTTLQGKTLSTVDLNWKEGLDAFTCTECGRCKDACPTFLTGKPLSQKGVNDSLKRHLLAERPALLATNVDRDARRDDAWAAAASSHAARAPADRVMGERHRQASMNQCAVPRGDAMMMTTMHHHRQHRQQLFYIA